MGPVLSSLIAGLGVALLGLGALAWAGWWRTWSRADGVAPVTTIPGVGVFLLTLGLVPVLVRPLGGLLALAAFLAAIGTWLVALSRPPWWGPRWWRERDTGTGRVPAGSVDVGEVLWAGRVPPERDSEFLVLAERAPATPRSRRPAVLLDPELGRPTLHHQDGAAPGSLLVFDDELVFAAERRDDATRPGPTIRVLPRAAIVRIGRDASPRDARVPTVVVELRSPGPARWQFEVARAGSLVALLRRTYGR